MGVPSSWAHVWMIGFVYAIASDIIISIVAGILTVRLYKVFHKIRNERTVIPQGGGRFEEG